MKILKSNFWLDKYINMGPQHTKRCRIATFGGMFSKKKVDFSIFSWENHDLWFLRLQWSSIVISKIINHDFLMKILKNQLFFLKTYPQMLLFCIFWYAVDPYWYICLAKNWISKFSFPPPIKNRAISHCFTKPCG